MKCSLKGSIVACCLLSGAWAFGEGVRYRGIFINDEDWSLRPWAIRHFGKTEQIGTNAYCEVFRLMKEDGLNLLWPAMHEGGYEFSSRPENMALANEWGIAIGTSHCEPMLRNNCYIPKKDKGLWSWTKHRDFVEDYWREGVRRGKNNEILWTIGMRGIHDGGMKDGKTRAEKIAIMESVFAFQTNLLAQEIKKAPTLFCPYKEVLPLYNAGLKVPDDAVIMWVNDNFGYVRRIGGNDKPQGIYWHLSYHGSPHGYIHLCTTPPAFMWYELVAKCWNNGVRDVWMVNAGDVFQAELLLYCYGRMASSPDAWGADSQDKLLAAAVEKLVFASAVHPSTSNLQPLVSRIVAHLNEYYTLGFIRKPEHMCIYWTQNLPEKVKRDLLARYEAFLAEDLAIEEQVKGMGEGVAEAYFRAIGFQSQFLAHAGIIHLRGRDKAYAYSVLNPLYARWDKLEGGKWSGFWCDTVDERGGKRQKSTFNRWSTQMQWPWNEPKDPSAKDRGMSRCDYPATAYRADVPEPTWLEPCENAPKCGGAWTRVKGLGTSGRALALLPVKPGVGVGATLVYDLQPSTFNHQPSTLVLQFLPDYALWPGLKLGVNVQFDDGASVSVAVPKSDSNLGEKDVVRNQAVQDNFIRVPVAIPSGAKRVKIIAVDPGVVIDRVGVRYDGAGAWPEARKEARPWAYNWWMGSAADEAGLRLQVSEMKRVGMGGMHVIPIYSVRDNPNDKVLLSPEWMKAFGAAVELAKKEGLGVDLTMGSGWCFGGPQLAAEDGAWMIEVNSKRLDKSTILWRGIKDGKEIVLSVRPTGQRVKRSGPGGHGPMMNPLSPSAMGKFLAPFTAAFDAPNAPKPEHLYHDSYEYFGAGWSKELPAAFAKRRGYRLEEHYAELAGVGKPDAVARVKCDYRETLSEMMVEDVFSQWTGWCRARGIGTRNEAHGAPANLLDFYALADIPETEMFSCDKKLAQTPSVTARYMNSGDRDILVSKFASSAAHVKHLGEAKDPLVSAESCTWISEHFCETLGSAKTFIDRLFLSGVNHMYYHGMCYSPADAKWPGWTFYASCQMNRFNPIWRDADILNGYVTRVQSVAQSEAIDNDILVYWPLHDFWMNADGFQKQLTVHARDWLAGQSVGKIARRLLDDGYAFDFISEKQLATLVGRLRAAGDVGPYRAIVVPGAKAMKPETFAKFVELSEKGFSVLFIDGFPTTVPGWKDVAQREAELKRLVASARLQAGSYEDLMATAPVRREPFNKANGLAFTRHAGKDVVTYFIANQYRDDGVRGWFKPASPCARAEQWDAMTGEIREAEVRDGKVKLDLPIGHSTILKVYADGDENVGEKKIGGENRWREKQIRILSAWTRTPVAGGPEFPAVAKGCLPLAWGDGDSYPECAFSGTMRYETTFTPSPLYPLPSTLYPLPSTHCTIDLGKVEQSAKVFVNGRYVGGAIMPPYRVTIPAEVIVPGTNTLAVEVTSTGANRLKWLDAAKPYPWEVFTDINMVGIDYRPLDASAWRQREYGLFGPVVLTLSTVEDR